MHNTPYTFFIALLFKLLFLIHPAQGQFAKFSSWEHDFGKISEQQETVTHRFTFENKGRKDLLLTRVENSCGCTLSEWSQGPVGYKQSGFVEVSFAPKGKQGAFSESITVHTNGEPELIVLNIKGNVITTGSRLKTAYPLKVGSLRFASSMINLGEVWHNGTTSSTITAVNISSLPIKVYPNQSDLPAAMSLGGGTITIAPNDSIAMPVQFMADSLNDWGIITDFITLYTDDSDSAEKRLHYMVHIKEKFDREAVEAAHPTISADRLKHDFGEITTAELETAVFKLSNTGTDTLLIRKVMTSCGCTVSEPNKDMIPPGGTTELKVFFQPENESGLTEKRVTVISNDPYYPEMKLYLYAEVTEK